MKVNCCDVNLNNLQKAKEELLKGETPKVAVKQVDLVQEVNFKEPKSHHRVSVAYDKDLNRPIVQTVDVNTGKVVKKAISDAEVDRMIRLEKHKGLAVDEKL